MTTDISRNQITGQQVLPTEQTDSLMGSKAALKTLETTAGYVPLDQRTRGGWKIASYHIANALTAGLVGQFGAACAHSQAMGSQKWYAAAFKDFGQTYLNARYDSTVGKASTGAKLLTKMHNFYTDYLGGTIVDATILLGKLKSTGIDTHQERLANAFSENFKQKFDRPPSFHVTTAMGVDELLEMSERGNKTQMQAATREADAIRATRTDPEKKYNTTLSVQEFRSGSPNLQAVFANHIASEFASESMAFMDWAESATRHIDGGPPRGTTLADPDAHYQLNKFDLMQAYKSCVSDTAESPINIPYDSKMKWKRAYAAHLSDFQNRWDRMENDHRALKRELANLQRGTPDYDGKKHDIEDVEAQMAQIKNEILSEDESSHFGPAIQDSYEHMNSILQPAATRLSDILSSREDRNAAPEVLQRRGMAKEANGTRQVFDDIVAKHGEEMAETVFRKFAMDSFGQAFMFKMDSPLDAKVLARMEAYIANPPAVAAPEAPEAGDNTRQVMLDGQYHGADYSDAFRDDVQNDVNRDANRIMTGADVNDWQVHPSLMRDVGRSTYQFNDKVVSGVGSNLDTDAQIQGFRQNAIDAGIPEDHLKKMSAVMHQGIFGSVQGALTKDASKAPLPFWFSDDSSDAARQHHEDAGVSFHIRQTEQPGVYNFVALTRNPLQNVQDFSDLTQGVPTHDTDSARSSYTLRIEGQIDCNKPNGEITLSNGHMGYTAVPATE